MPKTEKQTTTIDHETASNKTDGQHQPQVDSLQQRLELVLQGKHTLPEDISNSPLFKKRFKLLILIKFKMRI